MSDVSSESGRKMRVCIKCKKLKPYCAKGLCKYCYHRQLRFKNIPLKRLHADEELLIHYNNLGLYIREIAEIINHSVGGTQKLLAHYDIIPYYKKIKSQQKIYQDIGWLYHQYWDDEKCLTEIAELAGVTNMTIHTWMVKFDIPLRDYKESHTGKLNSNWKGGLRDVNQRYRSTTDYDIWRKIVFERDNYTCQCCNHHGGDLNAHHIKSSIDFQDLRLYVDNGITLCVDCHKYVHSIKGCGQQ